MLVYNIGISAIRANQVALQTIANNIANAATDGYHRQRVQFADSNPVLQGNLPFGTGVLVTGIERMRSAVVENALAGNLSQQGQADSTLAALTEIERLLTPSSGSIHSKVSEFFNAIEQMASRPSEGIFREQVISAAQGVAEQITDLNSQLDQLQQQLASDVSRAVAQVNELTGQIAELDVEIRTARAAGIEPNTLLDRRDLLVTELAKLVDLNPAGLANPGSPLVAAGGWLVVGSGSPQLTARHAEDGSLQLFFDDGRGPIVPASGQLAGMLSAHNDAVPETREAVREWTSVLLSGINGLQATGLGLQGGISTLTGSRAVSDPTVPLSQAGTLFPIIHGELAISVTDTATGLRTTHRIAIDPAVDSLQDVVDRINALDHVNVLLLNGSHQVHLTGESGYVIDFAGRPDSLVDLSGMTGTAIPSFEGIFEGSGNSEWVAEVMSDGEVGVTDGLILRVTDTLTGTLIAEVDVGAGYQAGQPLSIADGVSLRLTSGTLVGGETFSLDVVENPDTAGFLNALGIGSLFQTDDLSVITVDPRLVRNPDWLAASRTGDPADATQLERIGLFRNARLLAGGTQTVEERLTVLTASAGVAVQSRQAQRDQFLVQYNQLRDQQDAVSGVDSNEELLLMLEFQRAFSANAKFLTTVNETLDQLLGLVR